jgi:hypothetical protein
MKGKNIQMIKTSDEGYLFITDFNSETMELTFRTSRNPEHLQTEKIVVQENMVYTNLYFFHVGYLEKFVSNQ